jgi:hypothetical protein
MNKKFIEQHLKNITIDNLMDFQSDCFACMASSSSVKGMVKLGCSANGQFLVKREDKTWRFNNPAQAIEKYTELISL